MKKYKYISAPGFRVIVTFSFSLFTFYLGQGQQLQSYILEAEQNNPKLQAFDLRYNIALEKVNEVSTIPNTQFSAGYFVSEPETRTGAQRFKLSIKQMIPWFGTVTARKSYSKTIADTEYLDIAIAKRKLALTVSQEYYKLYAIIQKIKVLKENNKLLDTYKELALTSVQVGKGSVVEVMKLEIQQNELQQQLLNLQEQYYATEVSFNNILHRDTMLKVTVAEQLFIPEKDDVFEESRLSLNPELMKYQRLYESVVQSELLNQKESAPMLGFGLDYVAVAERPDMNFGDNGKDIIMPMVSLSIPIFSKKYNSKTKQNQLKQKELSLQREDRLNTLQTLLAEAISKRKTARLQFETQTKNVKQAKDIQQILIKTYETGTVDFNELLDVQQLQLSLQLYQIEAVKEYYKQSAIINYLNN